MSASVVTATAGIQRPRNVKVSETRDPSIDQYYESKNSTLVQG